METYKQQFIDGADSSYVVDQLESFLLSRRRRGDTRGFLALLWLHANHVPFTALPRWRRACVEGTVCRCA